MKMTRRSFLGGAGLAAAGFALEGMPPEEPRGPVYDFHVHLFGIQREKTGCFVSGEQRLNVAFGYLRRLVGLDDDETLDRDFVVELVRQMRESSLAKAVLVAQDKRYDERGEPDDEATHFYVPNDYLFRVVAENPDLFVPCVSINPKRRDALDELDRVAEAGARVLKIHPPTQDVNPAEERFRPFYRRMTEHGIVLMVHTGSEHASPVADQRVSDPARLRPALEEGCTVVAAHAGTRTPFDVQPFFDKFIPNLIELIERFPNLYCDTSILAARHRWRNLPRLLHEPAVVERMIHASDFPFPSNALAFWNRLSPGRLLGLCSETNLLERDFRLKQALGVPPAAFTRGAKLLDEISRIKPGESS